MVVEVDTSIQGITELLASLARVNYLDALADAATERDLVARVLAAPGEGFYYARDGVRDTWSAFTRLRETAKPGQPIRCDCEDQAAAYLAGLRLLYPSRRLYAVVSQPKPGAMAHAYTALDAPDAYFDPCVYNYMKAPPIGFYGAGDTGRVLVW